MSMANERKIMLRAVAPDGTPEALRSMRDVELVGRLYVLTVPRDASEAQREHAYCRLSDAVVNAHPDGQWTVLAVQEGWRVEAFEVA
jgi:hypothetical protein